MDTCYNSDTSTGCCPATYKPAVCYTEEGETGGSVCEGNDQYSPDPNKNCEDPCVAYAPCYEGEVEGCSK